MFLSSTGSKDTMTVTYEKCVAHYTQMLTLNAPVCVCTWWILRYIWITLRNCLWKVYTVMSTGVCCSIGFIIYNTRKMVARQLGSWRLRARQAVLLLWMGWDRIWSDQLCWRPTGRRRIMNEVMPRQPLFSPSQRSDQHREDWLGRFQHHRKQFAYLLAS